MNSGVYHININMNKITDIITMPVRNYILNIYLLRYHTNHVNFASYHITSNALYYGFGNQIQRTNKHRVYYV